MRKTTHKISALTLCMLLLFIVNAFCQTWYQEEHKKFAEELLTRDAQDFSQYASFQLDLPLAVFYTELPDTFKDWIAFQYAGAINLNGHFLLKNEDDTKYLYSEGLYKFYTANPDSNKYSQFAVLFHILADKTYNGFKPAVPPLDKQTGLFTERELYVAIQAQKVIYDLTKDQVYLDRISEYLSVIEQMLTPTWGIAHNIWLHEAWKDPKDPPFVFSPWMSALLMHTLNNLEMPNRCNPIIIKLADAIVTNGIYTLPKAVQDANGDWNIHPELSELTLPHYLAGENGQFHDEDHWSNRDHYIDVAYGPALAYSITREAKYKEAANKLLSSAQRYVPKLSRMATVRHFNWTWGKNQANLIAEWLALPEAEAPTPEPEPEPEPNPTEITLPDQTEQLNITWKGETKTLALVTPSTPVEYAATPEDQVETITYTWRGNSYELILPDFFNIAEPEPTPDPDPAPTPEPVEGALFQPGTVIGTLDTDMSLPYLMEVQDYNADGWQDVLVVAHHNKSKAMIWEGTGPAAWKEEPKVLAWNMGDSWPDWMPSQNNPALIDAIGRDSETPEANGKWFANQGNFTWLNMGAYNGPTNRITGEDRQKIEANDNYGLTEFIGSHPLASRFKLKISYNNGYILHFFGNSSPFYSLRVDASFNLLEAYPPNAIMFPVSELGLIDLYTYFGTDRHPYNGDGVFQYVDLDGNGLRDFAFKEYHANQNGYGIFLQTEPSKFSEWFSKNQWGASVRPRLNRATNYYVDLRGTGTVDLISISGNQVIYSRNIVE